MGILACAAAPAADNIIHWFLKGSHVIAGFYRINTVYDTTKLLGYMTTILASAMFLVHIETSFARHYRAFYRRIEETKAGMIAAARAGLANVLKLQIVVIGAVMLLAPDILRLIGLPAGQAGLLRISVLAANSQFTMLVTLLLLLYLDQRRSALRVTLLFVVANVGCTVLAIPLGSRFEGLGYLAAALTSAMVTLVMLFDRLRRLEYLTFMLQPVAQPISSARASRPVRGGWWAAYRRGRTARTPAAPALEAS